MEIHVFRRLKLSYDWLPNRRAQSCFLYCSLFPEDFKIAKNDLVHYWACEDFCGIEKGYFIISTLIRQGLLEEAGDYVKMHDVVRDMALWIACSCEEGEEETFFVRAGSQLNEVPQSIEWQRAKRVSLMANSFWNMGTSCSDMGTSCSDTVTLLLSHNPNLNSICKAPFHYMVKLIVLDLSETVIEELPLGLFGLKSVQYLNLLHTRLRQLPKQLNQLVKLKYLNLDHTCLLEMIPSKLLCNLLELRVLKMFLCGSINYLKVADNVLANGKLLIQELQHLRNLVELSITLRSEIQPQKVFKVPRLLKCTRALVLQEMEVEVLDISFLAIAEHLDLLLVFGNIMVRHMVVSNNQSIFSSLQEVVVSNGNGMRDLTWLARAPNLTILRVSCNDFMVSIISYGPSSRFFYGYESSNMFQQLQILELYGLQSLQGIYHEALAFPCLRQIDVYDCPLLRKLPLNSTSALGHKVVIKGGEYWWNNLKWEDDATKAAFSSSFQKI